MMKEGEGTTGPCTEALWCCGAVVWCCGGGGVA